MNTDYNENEKTLDERICALCNKKALCSKNRYFEHLLGHLPEIKQKLLMEFYRWCDLCIPRTRHESMKELKTHLENGHKPEELISYYYNNIEKRYSN